MSSNDLVLGLDAGSVSIDVAILDRTGKLLKTEYVRHKGRPMQVAADLISAALAEYGDRIKGCSATGSAGRLVAETLHASFVNEVIAQATGTAKLHPEVRTIIEIGGED